MAATSRKKSPRKVVWVGKESMALYFGRSDSDTMYYLPAEGEVEHTTKRRRFLFRQLNELHLNELRSKWTYIGDAYAALMIFLGISGVIMVKGKRGLRGRGGILMGLGILLPVLVLILWGR